MILSLTLMESLETQGPKPEYFINPDGERAATGPNNKI